MPEVVQFIAMDQFPNRINELRRAAEWSQEALAERMGTSKQQVRRYENGEQELTVAWMRRFAKAFGVSPADILNVEDNPDRLPPDARDLVDRYLSASDERRQDLSRVAETLIPFRVERKAGAA